MNTISQKKIYIITTTNEIDTYYSFLPTSYHTWKKIFPNCVYVLGLITPKSDDSDFVKRCRELSDICYTFKPLTNVESGVQAKTTRMYLSTIFNDIHTQKDDTETLSKDNVCMIVDIDYYLLRFDFVYDNIAPAFTDDKFVTVANNAYDNTPDEGKWQMTFTTAKSSIFKKLLNPNNLNYEEWFNSYQVIKDPIDRKESVGNKFSNFSDESLFRYLMVKYPDQDYIKNIWVKQNRPDFKEYKAALRIDRGWWGKSYDKFKLKEGYYIDSHPLRPFDLHANKLKPLLEYIGVDTSDENIYFKKKIVRRCRKNSDSFS